MPSNPPAAELDAELAFIQKKISEGVARQVQELEERHQRETADALRKANLERDSQWEKRLGDVQVQHAKDTSAAEERGRKQAEVEAARRLQESLGRQEAELAQKFRSDLETKNDALRAQLTAIYEKREQELKTQLAADKKAIDEELKRQADRELARDRRDLEETYQARIRKREEELKAQLDESFKVRESELRRNLEIELRGREAEARAKIEADLQSRIAQLEAQAEKRAQAQLATDRARLEVESAKKGEALEVRVTQEHKAQLAAEEARLAEKHARDLEAARAKIESDFKTRLYRRGRYATLARQLKAPRFPFPALVGQDKAKRALLLNAINPALGGVVLWGPEGNAKFATLITVAQLLAPIEDKLHLETDLKRPWSDEERYLTGRLHYGKEMGSYLVDTTLNTAALSLPRAGRAPRTDGPETHTLPPRLVGALKEEDEEAYHLIAGMTLHVEVASPGSVEERLEVMRRHVEFRKDPVAFAKTYAGEEEEIRSHVIKARERLTSVSVPTKVLALVARMTLLDKQSAHLDVLMEQLARTNAVFEGRNTVESADVMEAADLALLHRLTPRELADLERLAVPEAGAAAPKAK